MFAYSRIVLKNGKRHIFCNNFDNNVFQKIVDIDL